jgi:hypothetical protein
MARTPGIERIGTALPPSALPPPPDLSKRQSDLDLEIVRVLIGVDPQEVLDKYADAQENAGKIREEISMVSAELADLKARHWGSGTNPSHFDMERKELLSRVMIRILENMEASGEKRPTEKVLEAMAHGDKEYTRFLEDGRVERRDMERLQERLGAAHRRLETAQGVIEYYRMAHKSVDSLIYFATQNRRNGA